MGTLVGNENLPPNLPQRTKKTGIPVAKLNTSGQMGMSASEGVTMEKRLRWGKNRSYRRKTERAGFEPAVQA